MLCKIRPGPVIGRLAILAAWSCSSAFAEAVEFDLGLRYDRGRSGHGLDIHRAGDLYVVFFYTSGETYPPTFLNTSSEGGPTFMHNSFEFIGLNDFVVYVPSSVLANFNENQIINEVSKYNPVGTN